MHIRKLAVMICFATLLAASHTMWAASCSNATFKGVYGYIANGYDGTSTTVSVGQMTSTGTGSLSGKFTRSLAGTIQTFTFAGTYSIAKNCTGSISYTIDGYTSHYNLVVDETDKGVQLLRTDSGVADTGHAAPLATATCGLSGKASRYSAKIYGGVNGTGAVGYVGLLTLDGKGNASGTFTYNIAEMTTSNVAVSGTYTQSSNCTGTLQLKATGFSTLNFSTVSVDSNKQLVLIETDSETIVGGWTE